jgi:hypothetical protein
MGSGVRGTTGSSEGQSCTYSVELYRSLDAHIHTVTYFVFAVASIYLQAVVNVFIYVISSRVDRAFYNMTQCKWHAQWI